MSYMGNLYIYLFKNMYVRLFINEMFETMTCFITTGEETSNVCCFIATTHPRTGWLRIV